MNEPRTVTLDLWCRLISGEALDEVQRQQLVTLLQQDSILRAEIEADASVSALLRFTTDTMQTDDQFVQGVLDRCCAMPPLAAPNIKVNQPESHFAGQPDHFYPFNRALESTQSSDAIINVVTADQRVNQRTYSKRRQRSKWIAIAMTASISACVGLIVCL